MISLKTLARVSFCTTAVAASAAIGAYAAARRYTLRERTVHLSGENLSLRILHLSDFHALARNKKLLHFIVSLRSAKPDLLVLTGDFVAEEAGIDAILEALESFRGIPGFFVFGSNDYYRPVFRNPFTYLFRNSNERKKMSEEEKERLRLPTDRLAAGLRTLGFIDLSNTRAHLTVNGTRVEAVGVDDPHIHRDRYPALTDRDEMTLQDSTLGAEGTLSLGVIHAPYTRMLDQMSADGCDLILAGHTHGGQVCLPGHRALVTNCDLPTKLVSGLFEWPPTGDMPIKGDGELAVERGTAVHISAGLGTTPFVPLRTWCAPEAVLVKLERH